MSLKGLPGWAKYLIAVAMLASVVGVVLVLLTVRSEQQREKRVLEPRRYERILRPEQKKALRKRRNGPLRKKRRKPLKRRRRRRSRRRKSERPRSREAVRGDLSVREGLMHEIRWSWHKALIASSWGAGFGAGAVLTYLAPDLVAQFICGAMTGYLAGRIIDWLEGK